MSKAPVVLVNAFPVSRVQWEGLLGEWSDSLLQQRDVISFDMPGLGDMPMTDADPSLELIADAAVAAMREATGSRAAVWVGCSMGGYVAMAVAERDPDAVAGLGLIATRSRADSDAERQRRLDLAADLDARPGADNPRALAEPLVGIAGDGRDALIEAVAHDIAQHSGAALAWGQRAMAARPDRTEVLRLVDAPAVVIGGANDSIMSAADLEQMAKALACDVTTIAGAGHLCAWERPGDVAEALRPLW